MFGDFYIFDLRSNIGHDLVTLALIYKYCRYPPHVIMHVLSYHLIYPYVTKVFLGFTYFFKMGVNKGQVRSIYVLANT